MLIFSLFTILLIVSIIFFASTARWHHHPHPVQLQKQMVSSTIAPAREGERRAHDIASSGRYQKRHSILTQSQTAFFRELERQVSVNYHIFPKIRIADVIEIPQSGRMYVNRDKVLGKYLDFVICNSWLQPVLAIEINGPDHLHPDRVESDEKKRQVLEKAKLPLAIVPLGSNFSVEVAELVEKHRLT